MGQRHVGNWTEAVSYAGAEKTIPWWVAFGCFSVACHRWRRWKQHVGRVQSVPFVSA
jgi:hypothetical protein